MNKLDKILGGGMMEQKPKMDDVQIQAKLEVVQQLMQEMLEAMGHQVGSGLDSMKQVTVAAPDEDSLQEGLEIAQEVVPEVESDSTPAPVEDEEDDLFSMMQRKKNKLKG